MTEDTINKDYKPLDIREIFKQKNPKLARWMPGFIYRYLHRALVIDEVNNLMKVAGHKMGFDFANSCIEQLNNSVETIGVENLPKGGPFIIVSNHPLGGFDGALIMKEIGERYDRKYNVLVNDILMNVKNMDGTFVPVNKHGAQAMENVRYIDELFQSENHIMTFPAGLVSRRNKGLIRDTEWKKNFVSKAVQHKRDVITVHISGSCSNSFYNVANLRKFFRIKTNIEMFFLPRETFRHRNKHYTITIGKPISYQSFDRSKRPIIWAQLVRDYCYDLADNPAAVFSKTN